MPPYTTEKVPACCHPKVQYIRDGINEWLAKYWPFPPGKEATIAKHDLGGLAVWCVPAGDPELLIWVGRMCGVLLLADDLIDNDKDMDVIPSFKSATEGDEISDAASQAEQALYLTWRAVKNLSSRRQFAWNVKLTKAWYDTHYDAPATTMAEYLMARRGNVGVHMALNWMRLPLEIDLTDDVLEHPLFCRVEDLAADHCGIVNDYYSYDKEKSFDSDDMNIVRALMDFEHVDIVAARQRAEDLLTQVEQEFWQARQAVLEDPVLGLNSGVRWWMENLPFVLGGNISWSEENGRYNLTGEIQYASLLGRVDTDRVPHLPPPALLNHA